MTLRYDFGFKNLRLRRFGNALKENSIDWNRKVISPSKNWTYTTFEGGWKAVLSRL